MSRELLLSLFGLFDIHDSLAVTCSLFTSKAAAADEKFTKSLWYRADEACLLFTTAIIIIPLKSERKGDWERKRPLLISLLLRPVSHHHISFVDGTPAAVSSR